jgi:hypothetical protein
VRFWHALVFRVPPTIVLEASERRKTQDYADVSASCRTLVGLGFRVIVDASHNSISEDAVATLREDVLDLDLMPRKLIEGLTDLGDLHAALREADLADVAWAVLGGNPAYYYGLAAVWNGSSRVDIAGALQSFVDAKLAVALDDRESMLQTNERLAQLYERFQTADAVPISAYSELKLVRPSPDKVLRKVLRRMEVSSESLLVPATPAMGLVLRYKLKKPLLLRELKALISPPSTLQ